MKRVTQIRMYELGHLTRLREIKLRDEPERAFGVLVVGRLALLQFSQNVENQTMLPSAVERAKALADVIQSTVPNLLSAVGAVVSQSVVDDISRNLLAFETSLDDDLGRLPTYYVEKIGAYSSDDLIAAASNVFAPAVQQEMPAQAIDDFNQAGKCFAFDAATACGFHVFRATDAMLRKYCEHFGAVPKGNGRDWGTFIRELRGVLANAGALRKPNVRTVDLVDSIRAQDRNPLVHPELNLDSDGAVLMFDLCKNAISLMATDIKNSL